MAQPGPGKIKSKIAKQLAKNAPVLVANSNKVATFGKAIAKLARLMSRSQHVDWNGKDNECPVYAVGDIHGMADLLDRLLLEIEADAANLGVPARVIFLGDIVNRGPDSRKVVERLLEGPRRLGDEWLVLRGNHEQSLLDALDDDDAFEKFIPRGVQTMQSYGLTRKSMTRKAFRSALPDSHKTFLEGLPLTCRTKTHLFVHAGVLPGKQLQDQKPNDLLTIRERFFEKAHTLHRTVVHGHTPTNGDPVIAEKRIDIDTGAYLTGILTAVALQCGHEPRFLSVQSR
jgi:serine/threonine protein phosphatase 1